MPFVSTARGDEGSGGDDSGDPIDPGDKLPPPGSGGGCFPPGSCACADSDGDGINDSLDCDSPCHIGDPAVDCACQDDDWDGTRNQNDCDSGCLQAQAADCTAEIDLTIHMPRVIDLSESVVEDADKLSIC